MLVRETKQTANQTAKVRKMADRLLPLCNGEPQIIVELALILAYASVAHSTSKAFKQDQYTGHRFALFIERGSKVLVDQFMEISKMSDADIQLAVASTQSESTN